MLKNDGYSKKILAAMVTILYDPFLAEVIQKDESLQLKEMRSMCTFRGMIQPNYNKPRWSTQHLKQRKNTSSIILTHTPPIGKRMWAYCQCIATFSHSSVLIQESQGSESQGSESTGRALGFASGAAFCGPTCHWMLEAGKPPPAGALTNGLMQARRSLYAEYAECVGHQVPEGAPKIKVCKKRKY